MVKMIIVDIDGTILHKNKIHSRTIEAVQYAKSLNIPFVIATGRNITTIKPIAEKLGVFNEGHYFIGQNGGQVFKYLKNGEFCIEYTDVLDNEVAKIIFKKAKANKIKVFAYSEYEKHAYCTNKMGAFTTFMKFKSKRQKLLSIKQIDQNSAISKCVCFGNSKNMKNFRSSIDELNLSIFDFSYVSNAHANIEINPPGVNKAKGIKFICDDMKIDPKDVIYFGDGDNDIAALEFVGHGVAMINAKTKVKSHAKYITDLPVQEGGVGEYLFKNIFEK
ncbi:HAD superfamily hydrolase [Entomoplasma ellychniae]|uniref:HAD superfamily hydrolase n=1 Tax=Entomoplasma ellychniae TaxID=2114 RepID=A0A8E2QVD2_9MOLU|nr:HAD family hydrolase [Entomoplasma ellychniae]PPE04377.1 HAD superfamily hydrolase [Entomoplasma ellychniae]